MMEETRHPSIGKKKRGKRRTLLWLTVLAAMALGLGFVVTKGELNLSETLSTVREISKDATHDLRSTVDSAVRTDKERENLAARISELEDRVALLEARSMEPVKRDDNGKRLERRIEFELFSTGAFDLESIDVAVADGKATLTGTVRAEAERVLAERIAEEVPGVTQVLNELRIESPKVPQTGG